MAQRLKSLELQGYKTFATRTTFAFSSSVTAIVGPNGSGKSNIADAIRWVLGEQSYTLLRGRKTEDMIFSGSELRARAGMAHATMVFDNTDQWLPIEFSEVAITRRAYRDGQNEYLINGQRVRLKDVNELLARSGLSERTYTVIGQGLVDVALALKAEDRRQLFEEAAGIGIYRDRREEALRRLDSTKRNIERVYDLLSEIEPRLSSLEKQVKRLEEYEQIRQVLKDLLLEWYGYHWHREQKQLILQREFVRQREQSIQELRNNLSNKEKKLAEVRTQILVAKEQLAQWQQEYNTLTEASYRNTRDLAVYQERQQALRSNQINLEMERTRSLEELNYLQDKIQEAQQEQEALEKEVAEISEKVQTALLDFEKQQQEYEKQKHLLDELNGKYKLLLRQNAEAEARLNELITRIKQRRETAQARQAELTSLNDQYCTQNDELEQINLQKGELQEQYDRLQWEYERYQADENEKLDLMRTKRSLRANLEAERIKNATQLSILEQADQTLTDYSQAVQFIFRQRNPQAVLGVIGSMLQIPAQFEIAVAAYLGEFADTIIVKNRSTAESIATLLAQEKIRGVLLPMDGKAGFSDAVEVGCRGVIGWLKDLVEIDPDYKDILEKIFYRVLLVEKSEIALEVQQTVKDPPLIVTLNGELYYPQGLIVSAGKVEAGKLRRPREKKELQQKILEMETQIAALDHEINHLEKQIGEIQQRRKEVESKATALKQTLLPIDQRKADLIQEIERHKLRIEMLQKQLGELEVESQELEDQAEMEKGIIDALSRQLPQLEVEIQYQNRKLNNTSLDQYQRQVEQWQAYLRATERSMLSARERTQERYRQLELVKQNVKRIEGKQQETEQQLREIELLILELQEKQKEANEQREALLAKMEPLKRDIEIAEGDFETLNKEIQESQRFVLQQEQTFAQLRINLTRQQERFDALHRKIEEDFGLVAFEYEEDVSGQRPLPLDGMVETLPNVGEIQPELEENIKRYRHQLRRLGPVSAEAKLEYEEVKQRYQFMQEQVADLLKAEADILEILRQLDETIRQDFLRTYEAVAEEFKLIFGRLFKGGSARLFLTEANDLNNAGIEIEARLPGKRTQGLSLLSGGERSLTAVALIFALLKVSPTPFCVLDEVDAMLDEVNIGRFQEVLRELSQNTQFIIVTHNRNTVQVADVIYGVTMGRDSTSQVISLKLDELDQVIGSG